MKLFFKILGGVVLLAILILIGVYIFKGDSKATAPVSQPPAMQAPADSAFTDAAHGFSFLYPHEMAVAGQKSGDTYSTTWRQNTQANGLTFVTGTIAKSFQPKTNFSDAAFTVGESNDPDAVSACVIAQNGEVADGPVTINGIAFSKFTFGDAGAGNYYATTSYRTIRNGRCFAVEYTIHSTSLAAYDPSKGIKQFDSASVTTLLEQAVQSFKFLPMPDASSLVGTWKGVEGTSLSISKNADGFDLKFITLDGPVSATGRADGDAISFACDGKAYALFHGTGDDTGMRDFLGLVKKDCIVVAPYEGYCKD